MSNSFDIRSNHPVETVELVLVQFALPDDQVIREWFPMYTNIWEMQERLAFLLNRQATGMILYHKGEKLHSWIPIAGIATNPGEGFLFTVNYTGRDYELAGDAEGFSKTIEVRAVNSEGVMVSLSVEIEDRAVFREWCGAYRDKRTGVLYLHTWVQTCGPEGKNPLTIGKNFSKAVQTPVFPLIDEGVETDHCTGTQMWRHNLFIPTLGDKIVEAGNYSDAREESVLKNIPLIVKFRRLCLHFLRRQRLESLSKRADSRKNHNETIDKDKTIAHWKYTIDTVFPINWKGFENLFDIINDWYQRERQKLLTEFETPQDPGYKSFIIELYHKKLMYLKMIEKIKVKQDTENIRKRKMEEFNEVTRSQISYYMKGNITVTDTSIGQYAREMKEIYMCYRRQDYTPTERLEMLTELKYYLASISGFDLVEPLLDLVNREIDLTLLGFQYLGGLQLRISEMLYYCFTDSIDTFRAPYRKDIKTYRCSSCMDLKTRKSFDRGISEDSSYCTPCTNLRERNIEKPSLAPYVFLLEKIRDNEDLSENVIPTLMKPREIRYLVHEIWKKTIFSKVLDPYEYNLQRWDVTKPWKPWNCVLLSNDEALMHAEIIELSNFYGKEVVDQVNKNHEIARKRFRNLAILEKQTFNQSRPRCKLKVPRHIRETYKKAGDPFFTVQTNLSVKNKVEMVDVAVG